jgi:phosphoserine phosphatase
MGGDDITGGATHFWGPKAQAALGRPAPKWGRTGGLDIGETRFHREDGGEVEREGHAGGSRVVAEALEALRGGRKIFPKPQRMFPEGARPPGGEFIDAATGEAVTGQKPARAAIGITPEGKPVFLMDQQQVDVTGSPGKGSAKTMTNLYRKSAGWEWQNAPEGYDWTLVPADRKVTQFGLLVCDMDATLIENECVDELAALLPDPTVVQSLTRLAMEGRIPVEESLRRRIDALGGMPERAIRAILANRIVVRPGVERLIRLARTAGWQIVMVTGGFAQFAEPIARRLGITEFYCNSLDIEDERLKGTFTGNILDGPAKALASAAVAKRLNLKMRQIIALGDGANDADLLRNAGAAVGVRPKPVIDAIVSHKLHHAPLDAVWYIAGGD